MRVALDARWLQNRPLGGVGRGLDRLLPHLREAVDLDLLTDAAWPSIDIDLPVHALTTPWPHVATTWLQWSAPRWLRGFDGIFHCPWYALPYRQPVPMVVTLHDLFFESNPEWFRGGRARSFSTQARLAARTARSVVTVSRYVADDILARYEVPAERIVIAPNAVDEMFHPDRDPADTLARLGVRNQYVVAFGGAPRRRLEVAIAAWREVRADLPVDLVVLGTPDVPADPGIVGGFPGDEEYADLLVGARALLYPTANEGFGMPALEAIASGTPVVCARVGALPEVLGDAAAWTTRADVAAFASTLRRLLTRGEEWAEIRDAGIARAAAHPTWEESAAGYLAAYEMAG